MVTRHSDPGADSSIGGDATAAGQAADPIATKTKDLAQAGGPLAGEPAAGGSGLASRDRGATGSSEPAARRPSPDVPASNDVAPPYRSAMDDDLRRVEAGQTGRRGSEGR